MFLAQCDSTGFFDFFCHRMSFFNGSIWLMEGQFIESPLERGNLSLLIPLTTIDYRTAPFEGAFLLGHLFSGIGRCPQDAKLVGQLSRHFSEYVVFGHIMGDDGIHGFNG